MIIFHKSQRLTLNACSYLDPKLALSRRRLDGGLLGEVVDPVEGLHRRGRLLGAGDQRADAAAAAHAGCGGIHLYENNTIL